MVKSPKGADARRETTEQLARSSRGLLDPATVLREFLNSLVSSLQQFSTITAGRRLSYPLVFSSAFLLFCGLYTAIVTAWLIVVSYSSTPFSDQWEPLSDLASGERWSSLTWLWSQHNEHRVFLYRLSLEADLRWFGGRAILLFTLIYTTLLLHWVAWVAFLRKSTDLPVWLWMSVAGWFAFCLFNPLQNENLYWAFQWTFIASFAFAAASFLAFVWFSSTDRPWHAVAFASLGAFLSEACLANGILTWPVLWVASLVLPGKRFPRWTLLLVGLMGSAIYLHGYKSPGYHGNPLHTIRQPGRIGQYLLMYFGYCLTDYVTFPGLAATALTLGAAIAIWSLLKKRRSRPLAVALAMTMCFLFGTGLMTALGRLPLGTDQAASSRYETSVMLYWACAFTALFVAAWEKRSWRDIATLNLVALALVLLVVPELSPLADRLEERSQRFWSIGESLDEGAVDPSLQPDLVISRDMIERSTLYMHRLGETIGLPSPRFPNIPPDRTWDRGACEGFLDSANQIPRYFAGPKVMRADGWAIDLHTHGPAKLIAITDQNEKVLAVNSLHFPRPDVLAARQSAKGSVGWRLYVPLSPDAKELRAFAISGQHVCPIGVVRIPAL